MIDLRSFFFNIGFCSYKFSFEHGLKLCLIRFQILDFSSSFTGTEQDRLNIMTGARNRFFSENKRWVMGYYLVGINFTLWDGTETKLTRLTPFYPTQMQYNDSYHIAIPLV